MTDEESAFRNLVIDYVEDAILVFDTDWRIRVWNRGAERLYGGTVDEVRGRRVTSFMPMDLSPRERTALRTDILEAGRWRGVVTLQAKDGSTVEVEIISGIVRDDAGEIAGCVSVHRTAA